MRAHKKFDGSTGLLDLDFIFMFRLIDLRSGDKDGDFDGTLFQSDAKTLSVCRMAIAQQVFPLFIKPTGRAELIFKEFAFEGVDRGFWSTSGSSRVFKERSVSLVDNALLSLASQIQKEHSIKHLLICFIVVLMVQFFIPKLLKQYKTDLEQYPLAPTSTANRSTLKPLFSITLFRSMYLLILVLWQAAIFSSHGHS